MAGLFRVEGHALRREGAPYNDDGTPAGSFVGDYHLRGGAGRGMCSCGEMSEVLPSSYKRRLWHREHKALKQAQRRLPALPVLLGELLGCDPATISEDGFTMTPTAGGAVVHATLVKRLTREQADALGNAIGRHEPGA